MDAEEVRKLLPRISALRQEVDQFAITHKNDGKMKDATIIVDQGSELWGQYLRIVETGSPSSDSAAALQKIAGNIVEKTFQMLQELSDADPKSDSVDQAQRFIVQIDDETFITDAMLKLPILESLMYESDAAASQQGSGETEPGLASTTGGDPEGSIVYSIEGAHKRSRQSLSDSDSGSNSGAKRRKSQSFMDDDFEELFGGGNA